MEIIHVTSKEELDYLYDHSALTMVGLREESIQEYWDDFIVKNTTFSGERVFVFKGSLMNSVYGLTGTNAYQDHITFVSISLEDIDPEPIIFKRFQIGARWLDDIVDNNARRQFLIENQ